VGDGSVREFYPINPRDPHVRCAQCRHTRRLDPVGTLAANGIKGLGKFLEFVEQNAALKRSVTIEQVGNSAAFLLSDLAAGVTAEIVHVDSGFNTVAGGMTAVAE
jgi:enoyl-[acyl-carrier protein] reductase I